MFVARCILDARCWYCERISCGAVRGENHGQYKQRVGRVNHYGVHLALSLPQPGAPEIALRDVLPIFPLSPTIS